MEITCEAQACSVNVQLEAEHFLDTGFLIVSFTKLFNLDEALSEF